MFIMKIFLIILIGIIIGFIVGIFVIQYGTIYHAPDSNVIKKTIFYCSKTDKYYKFEPVPYICPPLSTKNIIASIQTS